MKRRYIIFAGMLVVAVGVNLAIHQYFSVAPASTGVTPSAAAQTASGGAAKPVFAIYYMWWDRQHWVSHLGAAYPTATPNPLPATLDASGCAAVSPFAGNVLTDVSQNFAYDQTQYQTFETDVRAAAAAGLNGFNVNWVGDGTAAQPATSAYNQRLAYMFQAVHKIQAEGTPFKLMFNYQSSAKIRPLDQFTNDFNYLLSTYGTDPALDHTYSKLPEMIMAGTWKYTDTELAQISAAFRGRMYLLGDEKPSTWNAARAGALDGTSYYWSSQDPVANPKSFDQLAKFAAQVRATKNPDGSAKLWLAPFTPGYNAMLLYHTNNCVPRSNGATMSSLFRGNQASAPDGWTFISWNEISEGSYVVPLTRYGDFYTKQLKSIIEAGR